MIKNIKILSHEYCTGCGLCYNICPQRAIAMVPDSEGFLYPYVNHDCVGCGICVKKCPILSQSFEQNKSVVSCFVVQSNDNDRLTCSSGGAFKVFAQSVLKSGGVICGAAFNNDFTGVDHIVISNKKSLDSILRSKYVQSSTGDIYVQLKKHLDHGETTIFSGCPCQVAALKRYLNRDYSNLITIDLLCHGVPSPMSYQVFLKEKNPYNKPIKMVNFRDKSRGWGKNLTIEFQDGDVYKEPYNGLYMRAFSSGLNMRESCYNCPWADKDRPGDITMGDFWGCEQYDASLNDKMGTSIIMCNTKKGDNFVKSFSKQFALFKEISFADAYKISERTNGAICKPVTRNSMRECFFRHLKLYGFTDAIRYSEKSLLDVGIVGWWIQNNRSNYGSTLTDYALGKFIESLGLSVAYISPPNFNRDYAGDFNKRYGYRMTAKYDYASMTENNKYIKTFVVASDVLWYYDAMKQTGYTHMLDFVDDSKKKIAYASSFGKIDKFIPSEEFPKVKYLLSRFDAISMREEQGVEVLKDVFSIESVRTLDPVFLCGMKDWDQISNNSMLDIQGDFVFSYLMDPTNEKAQELKVFADRHGCKLVTIPDRQNNYQEKAKILENYGLILDASLEDYLYCFKHARYVVSDSFHGLCFSIIFRKPFYSLVNHARGASRFEDLTNLFKLSDRLIENMHDLNVYPQKSDELDYTDHEKYIALEIAKSKNWLSYQLYSDRNPVMIDNITKMNYELYCLRQQIASK